ncbi:hypothetical protein POM88_001593 [Heracleum sosnowskyi]|uniref:GH16 domain-containing protein n=1 Tax=Heracleum sosnowskyi TaxID=360622 RepID=A0AAD8NBU0_9APIA|nr:hypothetical protein POM88_001593 [Heracleum sosnowskyi]
MKIKLIPGDSAGTVTAFYMNFDTNTIRDELDFEFLGNRTGQPYTVQTNVYAHGKGDRKQRVNLWFDPAAAFHTYSILWSNECNMMREIIGAGQPYTVQTNVYAHGKGDREQKVNLWFDPATAFHTYSILWSNECNMMRDIIGAGEQEEVTESIVFPEASMSK